MAINIKLEKSYQLGHETAVIKSLQAPHRKLEETRFFLLAILFALRLNTEAPEKNKNAAVVSLQVR